MSHSLYDVMDEFNADLDRRVMNLIFLQDTKEQSALVAVMLQGILAKTITRISLTMEQEEESRHDGGAS